MRSKRKEPSRSLSFIEEARQRQLIDATVACVAAQGYAGASLAKVAQKAGVSKSVVVYHFSTKDRLLEAAVTRIYGDIWAFVQPRLEAETTARGQLRAYLEAEFAFLETHREQLLTLSHILPNHRDRHGQLRLLEQAEKTYREVVGSMLERGQRAGEFRRFAVKPMAATLMYAVNGALAQWAGDPTLELGEYARELVTLFDLGTRAGKGRGPGHP